MILRGRGLDYRAAARATASQRRLREQRHGIVATGVMAAFTPAVLAIVAVAAPAALPAFVLADRLAKFAGMAVSPLLQMFQGWVPAATGAERVRRTRLAGAATGGIAVTTGIAYTLLLPTAADLLAHGQIDYPLGTAIAFGLIATLYVGSSFVSTVALMAGRVRLVALAAVVGRAGDPAGAARGRGLGPGRARRVGRRARQPGAWSAWQLLALRAATLTPGLTPNNPEPLVSRRRGARARVP